MVIAVATVGNFLGGITSYGIGRLGKWEWIERFGANRESIDKHKVKIDKYGAWTGLLSWLPIIGDVIAIALGFFRVKFLPSAILMLIGRFARFVVWYVIYAQF